MTPSRSPGRVARILGTAVGCALAGCHGDTDTRSSALLEILEVEDARPATAGARQPLRAATGSEDLWTRRFAVRALGRLEDPSLLSAITPLLGDAEPEVRAVAAWAAAQAVHGADGTPALEPLRTAASSETDPTVRGALARSLGRVRPSGLGASGAVPVLARWSEEPDLPTEAAVGIALGLESLSRASGPASADTSLYEALTRLTRYEAPDPNEERAAARVRAVATMALGQRGQLSAEALRARLADADPAVRATATRFVEAVPASERRTRLDVALGDSAAIVRVEAARGTAEAPPSVDSCEALLALAASDANPAVRVVALDGLGTPCPDPVGSRVLAHLDSVSGALSPDMDGMWAPSVHALGALVRIEPSRAQPHLAAHAAHSSPFVRTAAAQVAEARSDEATLRDLVADPHPNVRNAALPALFDLEGRNLDTLLVDQLDTDDAQLLITVTALLEGTEHEGVASEALDALDRISEAERETARDARLGLVELIRGTGGRELSARLEPYLADYDPVVAEAAAATIGAWTGEEPPPTRPEPLPRLPLPSAEEIEELAETLVVLRMARGGEIVIELLPFLAPTNAARFARLVREGYFDGLTFHRWVPNFVIQGGSPAANEYTGDGPYTRDELGAESHWRGTVGLSTRGRDTGDGQIFVSLVDNVRLDHDYTAFGRVVAGMETVDAVLPGDVIERTEIRPKH